jgi:putative tryptophan/tyrosine transport system substrate-binding protein
MWRGQKGVAMDFQSHLTLRHLRLIKVVGRELSLSRATEILQPVTASLRGAAEVERAFEAFAQEPNGGLIVLPGFLGLDNRDLIIRLARQYRLPAIYAERSFVARGDLMSYSPDITELFRRAASYVDRILRGGKPAELPVQLPTKFEMALNLKTVKALGLTIPESLLAVADEVIQ